MKTLLRREARQDECRKRLWEPVLSVGIAFSEDRPAVAIVTPWHPFRLAEAATKARLVAGVLARMLGRASEHDDVRTFSRTMIDSIARPWHPGVVVRSDGPQVRLLVETECFANFSLFEVPTADEGADRAFDGYSKEAAVELIGIANEYLELQPHERANFSVVLYNADNRELPARLAERLARKIETEPDLQCDLILTHTDQQRLRQIYAEQNVAISNELDGALASEAAQTFLSRLRVGFLDAEAVSNDQERQGVDLVFLHDVVARSAKLAWRRVEPPARDWPHFLDQTGVTASRRRPFEKGARKTEVLLVTPERSGEVQAYLDLVHDLHQDERDLQEAHWVPIREIVFDDANVGDAIARAHQVGNWVVTFDAIADPQLMRNNGVSIIRFLTRPGWDHNLIVSTKRHGRTLTTRIADTIGAIADLPPVEGTKLAEQFVEEAARISGRVVLHAARNEQNALELVGLVLSRRLLADALPPHMTPVAWLLLDDFAGWVGHSGGKKADILVVALGEEDGRPIADLIVVESKFVGQAGEAAEAKESLAQIKESTAHIRDRIVGGGDLLNRPTWLGRLADLVAEHGVFESSITGRDASTWANTLRSNEAILRIRGTAFVFVHDRREGRCEPLLASSDEQKQYLFDRQETAMAIKRVRDPVAGRRLDIALPPPVSSDGSAPAPEQDCGPNLNRVGQELPSESRVAEPAGDESERQPDISTESAAADAPSVPQAGRLPAEVESFVASRTAAHSEADAHAWLDQVKQKLRVALRGYGLDAEIVGERLTPNSALVRFKGTDRMTLPEVERRRGVLLTSHGLDVIGVRPQSGEVVVMVARERRASLDLCSIWTRRGFLDTVPTENTSFVIGEREVDGNLLYLNLGCAFSGQPQHGPHTLIAGETGGGKGMLTRNIILELCATNSPRNARIRMIDPKSGGDYPWIGTLPHLDGELITNQDDAGVALKDLVQEMERRYAIITKTASNIDRYNAKMSAEQRLPRIYLFHDELGDWMADKENADYREAVESYVVRLASKARAAGIHLFLVTQRPDKDALPGQIKANMNNKICLRVSSQTNSRIVLDENGAETLLGNGHFAAKLANERPSNQTSLIFAQAPFLEDDAAFDLAASIRQHWVRE
jgi:DNA segregation ATPase FtsK/SpoIIIE, S-DNA-T family